MVLARARPRVRWLLTLLALPIAVTTAEVLLRAADFRYSPLPDSPLLLNEHMFDRTAEGGVAHRFDAATIWAPSPLAMLWPDTEPTINAAGYRGPVLPAEREPRTLRVALLGESSLFGYGVMTGQTVTELLPPLLADEERSAEVFNASVIAFSIVQGLERYRAVVRPLHPDVVCVAFGNHNDAAPAHGVPDVERVAGVRAAFAGDDGPWRWLLRTSRAVQSLAWLADRSRGAPGATPIAPHTEAELADARSFGALDWPGQRRVPPEQYRELLERLADEVAADGARLVVCRLPLRPQAAARFPVIERYGAIQEQVVRERGLPYLDLRPALAAARAAAKAAGSGEDDLFIQGDAWHLDAAGHAVLATELARVVRVAVGRKR